GAFAALSTWPRVSGFELRQGRISRDGAEALFGDEGCHAGNVLGTSWHGVLEGDDFRRALLRWVAAACGRGGIAGRESFAAVRERRLDALGDLVEQHSDTAA